MATAFRIPGALVALALALAGPAAAQSADPAPLAIHIDCQTQGRTKACPAFLRGFIDESSVLRFAPRADADVVLHVNVTGVGRFDRVHLRFVGEVVMAPASIEALTELDTRATDDAQRDALRRGFLRGIALYVAVLRPEAVEVTLAARPGAAVAAAGTPWGMSLSLGGRGSYTEAFRSFSGNGSLTVSRVEADHKLVAEAGASVGVIRQPGLVIGGETVSLDSDQFSAWGTASAERHLSEHWSVGGLVGGHRDDPEGQYWLRMVADLGIEWDRYASNDPRGNNLAVGYELGWDFDHYNVDNELGQRRTHYPSHDLFASASVRKDQVTYELYLEAWAELVHPDRRHRLSASPSLTIQLGDHVDLSLAMAVTQRELPGPAALDPTDYEQVTRASYAEPFSLSGSLSLHLHWDRSNGAQNDRFGGDD